ncbi:MAG: transporter substrate-binding domain-containing protein [Candidatus Cloacimonetes bacterium]|nr:transporter substrate-binding domain-containing protein [Candidatus Cloacimonadota bacterium]
MKTQNDHTPRKDEMMSRKYYFIILIILLISPILCNSPEEDGTFITVGCEPDYPPYCLVDANGEAAGFSIDLIRAAAEAVNIKITFKVDLWNILKNELAQGKIDALPMVGRTPEREAFYDFTFPYLSLHGAVFVRNGDTSIQTPADLKNKEIIVMKGDNAEEFARRVQLSERIITTETFQEAFKMLKSEKGDAVITQRVMGQELLNDLNITSISPLDIPLNEFRQNFCFAVTEGNKALLEKLNEGLAIIISNGTFDRIHQKWFTPIIDHSLTLPEMLKIAAYFIIPIVFIIFIILIIIMRSEVKRKTSALRRKMQEHNLDREELIENEKKFRSYVDNAPIGIFVADENGNYLDVNAAATTLTGYTREELLNMRTIDFTEPALREAALERIKQLSDVEQLNVEIPFITKSGETRFWQIVAVKLRHNRYLGFTIDMTEKKIAQEKLQENKDQLQYLFDNMNSGFAYHEIILDEKGKPVNYIILKVNSAFERMLSVNKDDIIGKKITDALPGLEDDPFDWIGAYGKVALTGQAMKFENYSQAVGKWFSISAYSPMKGYFATVFEDITGRKKTEEELLRHHENLEKLVQERTRELEDINKELQHFNGLFVGREFRIKELRDKVKSLELEIKKYQ